MSKGVEDINFFNKRFCDLDKLNFLFFETSGKNKQIKILFNSLIEK